ncbi:Zn(2)-C6 fungal-type domain-containing protein [Mycena sanguinolenta]|uniref:Zn(2)-C6 fungal-type domain-containing protein n=1 Tax=Mycena sanguinolenta TaxID=230812 RepID=A0A8H6Z424_9AGAR|nr:Zn(2)-C6 fungal-type domain-containing protein [Mycena sanguinolenta]
MPKGPTNARTRGPYSTQACNICRTRKSKCDGVKPVCGSCAGSGRTDECSWGRDAGPKKARTEAHFESLRKRIDTLQAYVDLLEGRLAKCICQDGSSHLQFRPLRPEEQSGEEAGGSEIDVLDSDDEFTQDLTVPTQRLKLESGPLLHGAVFKSANAPSKDSRVPEVIEDPNASYILLVDGVDISHAHSHVDWSRHLPPEVVMERREHDQILDLASKFHSMVPVVPSLFFRDMYRALSVPRSEEPPMTSHYSPMLHNAVLSVVSVLSDNQYLRDLKTRQHFVQAAQAFMDFKKPNHSTVNALAFIGAFYTDCGERIPAELYYAMSTRLSVTLDLGFDASQWVKAGLITHDEMKGRNWTFWCTFSVDVMWNLFWGRPIESPPRNTPMSIVDHDIDQLPWYYAPSKLPPQPQYFTLMLHETSTLCLIACQIAEVVNHLRPSAPLNAMQVAEQVTRIDLELNNWKSRLPPQMDITLVNRASSTPHRLMLHLAYWWCFITLHRPFFNRRMQPIQHSDPEVDHVKLCIRAAENALELLETWSSLFTMRLSSYKMAGVIFSAGTVFFLRALQATGSSRTAHGVLNTALAQVETCIRYLHEMGHTWESAKRSGDMLQSILNDRLKPVIARRMAERGELIPAAASPLAEPPAAVSGHHETSPQPAETTPFYSPSHTPEWDPQLQPWSELLFDFNFFAQMHNPQAASDVESSCQPMMTETAFPELFQAFDTLRPEQDDESRWRNFLDLAAT